jgi:hypothetical protein
MSQITERDIKETACLLVAASTYRGHGSLITVFSVSPHTPGLPSVQEGFDAFLGLPEGHPLRNQFSEGDVRTGYAALKRLRFDPNEDYEQLRVHIAPPQ